MTPERFQHLLHLYKSGELSTDEWEEFRNILLKEGYKNIVEADIDEALARFESHETWTPALSRGIWESILERRVFTAAVGEPVAAGESVATSGPVVAGESVATDKPVVTDDPVVQEPARVVFLPARRRKIIVSVLTAAALLALVVAIYLLLPRKTQGPAVAEAFLPGGNKAMLILGDGTRILLDSASNGILSQRNGVRIEKQGANQITYVPADIADSKTAYNTMETPRGGEYQLQLPDGTKVWLNSASSITYPDRFTGSGRQVEMKGEAYFEVAKNARQPFTVSANGVKVQVLGTSFNIMAYPDEGVVGTTLVDGSVKVQHEKIDVLIQPGEQLNWAPGHSDYERTRPDLRTVLAWKEGRFRFNGIGIAAIMRQISRWYDVDVEYRGKMPDNEFAGSLPRKEYATEILDALEVTRNVHFEIQGRKIIVYPGPKEK